MVEFRVVWCQCPHVQHTAKVLFVEADTKEDAEKIARDHVERRFSIEWFTIQSVTEAPAVPPGRVIER